MIRYLKHIVRIIIVFALIMCWGISLGYANNIGSKNKTLNFYFENENYNVDLIKDIKKSQPELSVVGWIEETLQTAENPDLGKIASDLDILTIKGSSNLLVKGSNLFVDDLDGCLIDSNTSSNSQKKKMAHVYNKTAGMLAIIDKASADIINFGDNYLRLNDADFYMRAKEILKKYNDLRQTAKMDYDTTPIRSRSRAKIHSNMMTISRKYENIQRESLKLRNMLDSFKIK